MNNLTMERRIRFERGALDHILDRRNDADKAKIDRIISAEAALSPAFARRRARIAKGRSDVNRRAGHVAAAGAIAVVGASVAMGMLAVALKDQVVLLFVGGLVLGLLRLVMQPGRPSTAALAMLWSAVSLLPLSGAELAGIDLFLLALGWLAIAARAWLQGSAHDLDRDEIQLMLDAQGREAHVQEMRRKVAALI